MFMLFMYLQVTSLDRGPLPVTGVDWLARQCVGGGYAVGVGVGGYVCDTLMSSNVDQ